LLYLTISFLKAAFAAITRVSTFVSAEAAARTRLEVV